ncbi:hypothetical protein [Thermosediminibacter litoriperuensis]|uniref:Uncharacterized protein n=1 Tax=Thermosediminibacter litoriperuensis TaxID=291989 RepID=A0A5S5AYU3_9FIRM|nr:hypothetical protein [Thermosediminibacter litoriperuensis]TYP59881.1 hypothetical protein LZ11_00041 [Thermosediminibacter litoriperuensis]
MSGALERVMDAVDIETFLVCDDEEEGKRLSLQLMNELGFKDASIVFIQHQGPGARVRIRGYIYKPGDSYAWLFKKDN